ncbi:MAG: response regulator [Desulfobacteraceae bacterium]|nr:MAG: response regulator [Desulfobacteraceae bacterium]
MTDEKYYTVPEAAKKFGVNRRTMSRWVSDGKVQSIVTPGGHYRVKRSEIELLLKQNGFKKKPVSNAGHDAIKILIVDDDESVRKTLQAQLGRNGFQVITSSNGFDAGLKAKGIKPDLIILDLVMEGMDGFEVCQVIKKDRSMEKTKIVILSGFDTPENRTRALKVGADCFISKAEPFDKILMLINKTANQ